MLLKSYSSYTPMYESAVTFTVQTQQLTSGNMGLSSYSFSYNRSTAAQLANTFPSIIRSNILQDVVCNDLDLSYFPCILNASSVSGTNMFTITARGAEPQNTYDVLVSVIENYPVVAQYIIGNTDLVILNAPEVPTVPYNQFSFANQFSKGMLIGLLLAVICVFIYTTMRQTIRSRTDIRTKLNQKCIGVLPEVIFKRHKREIDHSILLINPHIGDSYRESFRALRTSILNTTEKRQVIMVTSTAPGEGKTSVSANLAVSLAMMNKKVLLLDADIRNPNVNACFGIKATDTDTDKSAKISHLKIGSSYTLSILNFNASKRGMWDLLNLNHFRKMIDQLRSRYDYIIVDTSPLGLTSEPAVILQAADATILVIKHDTVRSQRILSVINILNSTGANLIGCVLNNVSPQLINYGYKYGYHYNYGRYGYGYHYGYGQRYGYGYGRSRRSNTTKPAE